MAFGIYSERALIVSRHTFQKCMTWELFSESLVEASIDREVCRQDGALVWGLYRGLL